MSLSQQEHEVWMEAFRSQSAQLMDDRMTLRLTPVEYANSVLSAYRAQAQGMAADLAGYRGMPYVDPDKLESVTVAKGAPVPSIF